MRNETSNTAATVTEMDCLIFTGQAFAFAGKLGGYVSYISANYADVKAADGREWALIGPASGGDDWIKGNRRLVKKVLAGEV